MDQKIKNKIFNICRLNIYFKILIRIKILNNRDQKQKKKRKNKESKLKQKF